MKFTVAVSLCVSLSAAQYAFGGNYGAQPFGNFGTNWGGFPGFSNGYFNNGLGSFSNRYGGYNSGYFGNGGFGNQVGNRGYFPSYNAWNPSVGAWGVSARFNNVRSFSDSFPTAPPPATAQVPNRPVV
jgi:hypothetical protein